MTTELIRHAHLFCGIGGGAAGFNDSSARVGSLQARYECAGGIDVDARAIKDFELLTGTKGTVMDLFTREQYIAWHGHEPPADWREATPGDIRKVFGPGIRIMFTSPPCKGLSGLLAETHSKTAKYQALNKLTLRGIWLTLEAYKDDPIDFFLLENVPRIQTRGRHLLDQIISLLEAYGYAARETTHDCGEIGGLAQSRRRFLLVARHQEKVPAFLYEPRKRALQSVGSVLSRLPLPGDPAGGPMHRVPSLAWKTWVRLAFVEAGKDWRSLNRLVVEDGVLRDYLLVPEMHNGALGVRGWGQAGCTVTGGSRVYNGAHGVADPRIDGHDRSVQMGVRRWNQPAPVVTGKMFVGGGPHSVADPRPNWNRTQCVYRVVRFDERSPTVIAGGKGVQGGQLSVADPRPGRPSNELHGKFHVTPWQQSARAVIAGRDNGAFTVADPRWSDGRKNYITGGHYGVLPFDDPSYAVSGSARHDNGHWSVADPRGLPAADDKLQAMIIAEDNTWHRPFTTLELACLQSLIDPEDVHADLRFAGNSDSAWREGIGNAVPRYAAREIGSVMGQAILMSVTGETFILSDVPVWVRDVAVAIALPGNNE